MNPQVTQSTNSNPTIQYRTPTGQTITGPLNEAPPQVQLLYQQLPQAQAQTSTAISGAQSAAAGAVVSGVQAKQAPAQIDLGKDLANKMTLPDALKKYTPLGKSPDEIFNQYLASSPWGLPNENPQTLQNLGVSAQTLGQIGTPGSFMDRYNTKNAIAGLRNLEELWNKTNSASRLAGVLGLNVDVSNYNTAKEIFGNHLSTLIPGAPGAQQTAQDLLNTLPNANDPREDIPGKATGQFSAIEDQLLKTKGYSPKDIGVTNRPGQSPQNQSTGKDILNNLLNVALPTGGAIGGGILGGALDLPTGAVPGAIVGAGVGGAGGQALADVLTGKTPGGDVLTTGILSGAGQGVGAGLGKVLGMAGGAIGKYGENLISKNLNLTPKMAADAASNMGVKSIPEFLSKEGLRGANYEKVSSAAEPIQKQFDAIANNPNIKIDPSKVIDGFDKEIQTLKSSILPADQAKAKVLDQIANNFIDKFGNANEIGADAMTALRRQVDLGVRDFGSEPLVASTGNLTRNILQKSIQEADPTNSLDPLGTKLHQYYTLLSKAEPRQFASQAKPLLNTKSALAGFIGNIFGGPVGAGAGIGLERLLGSSIGVNTVSKGAINLSKILGSQAIVKGASLGGAATGGGIGAILGLPQ